MSKEQKGEWQNGENYKTTERQNTKRQTSNLAERRKKKRRILQNGKIQYCNIADNQIDCGVAD
jgi:hypothetical protein